MITNYGLDVTPEGIMTHKWVGPVADLRGIEHGLEGQLSLYAGEGDQQYMLTQQGTLEKQKEEDEKFKFVSEVDIFKRIDGIDHLALLLGDRLLKLEGRECEDGFLHQLFRELDGPSSPLAPGFRPGVRLCSNYVLSQKGVKERILKAHKGVLNL